MAVVIEIVLLLLLVHLVQGQLECDRVITVNTTLDYVLSNIQSNDCVNITSDSVSLSEVVEINNISNITISGDGNTIVMCNNTGGVSCNNCSNVVIGGITWDRCFHNQNQSNLHMVGGIQFSKIANLNITNCSFQYSKIRALSLLNVSGAIVVDWSNFLFNANDDTITCANAQTGYIHCSTSEFASTGGLYIEEATSNTTINIINSVFRYNGHFGHVVDKLFLTLPFNSKYSEIADGAGLKILLSAMDTFPKIEIENSTFDSNRGRCGSGLYIHTINSSTTITLKNVEFQNNSVIKPYIRGAALQISFEKGNVSASSCSIFIDTCKFLQNTNGETTASVMVAGTSNISMDNCTFVENEGYEAGLVELNAQFNDNMTAFDISNCIFKKNTGNALIYIKTDAGNNRISIHNVHAYNNIGYSSTSCRAGFVVFKVNNKKNCSVRISNFTLVSNHHLTNQSEASGLYITGRLNTNFSFQLHIEDSKFKHNIGKGPGAVIYCALAGDFYLVTIYNSTFSKNTGDSVIYIEKSSNSGAQNTSIPAALIIGSNTKFNENFGTALQLSNMVLIGYQNTSFVHNKAVNGSALFLSNSYLFLNCSNFAFIIQENLAYQRGGAIYITSLNHWLLGIANSSTEAISDLVQDYLSYYDDKDEIFNQTDPNECQINLSYNIALITGSTIYIQINANNINAMLIDLHNSSDPKSLFYIPECFNATAHSEEIPVIVTQPQRLQLKSPAICEDGNATNCIIPDIMLGQDINVPASIYGYNDEPAETTRFLVNCTENCVKHKIIGDTLIRVYRKFSGIKIKGTKINRDTNESMLLGVTGVGIDISIVVNIILVPCHVGYKYNKSMEYCDCCTVNDIVSCTDEGTAMIKRNYWFGVLDEVATVSACPNGYCSFAHGDEVSPGKYLLSKTQDNQCASHRTGQACGRCAEGYTLSFDSTVCVSNEECTAEITTVVVMCSFLYWVTIMGFIFVLMYYKINIGYFYGIIHCYSIIDILFGSILNLSDELNDFVTISVGIAKTTPKFLGKLCFVQGLKGIDQQAIHFVHPAILLLILYTFVIIAKHSRKFTMLISTQIIHVICLILLLAYTSIADTSLQLLRYLKFADVDEVYTYVSPDHEYLTGRHIIYFIIAVLLELTIVIGLPGLLLVEPLINRWVNFTKVKPLLDQFQGCYKEKYRWFAGIYLLFRQVMILIILLVSFPDQYTELYLLVVACLIVLLMHHMAQPYKNDALNKYDGIILHILVLVVTLQMVTFSNGFTPDAIVGMAYGLFLLPAVAYIALVVFLKRHCLFRKCTYIDDEQRADEHIPLLQRAE